MNLDCEKRLIVPLAGAMLLLVAGASLAVNLVCLSQIRSMRREQAAVTADMDSLRAAILATRSAVTSLGREAAWYDTPRFELATADGNGRDPVAKIAWTFRELASAASVEVSYRVSGEWRQAQVTRVGGNTFEAAMPLPGLQVEPVVQVTFTTYGGDSKQRAPERVVHGAGAYLEYVISAEEGGVRKSGQAERISLDGLGGVFQVRVSGVRPGVFSVGVVESSSEEPWRAGLASNTVEVSRVDLCALTGGVEQARIELSPRTPGNWNGTLTLPDGVQADLLKVMLTLSGGRTVEKEIPVG